MMKYLTAIGLLLNLITTSAFAYCDLTQFRWDCDIPLHTKPTKAAHSLVYCGQAIGYITQAQYAVLERYQRADVNMDLNFRGEHFEGPCIPAGR